MSPQTVAGARERVRRASTALLLLGLILGSAIGSLSQASAHETGTGLQGDGPSDGPDVAAGGLAIAFESEATNLVADDTNGVEDVFVHDNSTGKTVRVSVSSAGVQANGPSTNTALSGDGSTVAFDSSASNLVSGDTNGQWDSFVHNLQTGATERVSVSTSGTQGTAQSAFTSISDDGRFVVFHSYSQFSSADTGAYGDIYLRDTVADSTELISVSTSGTAGNTTSFEATDVSTDGRYVAFGSPASNLVSTDTNGKVDVFLRDRTAATTTLVSVNSSGAQGNDDSAGGTVFGATVSLSDNGRYIAFPSRATNLVATDSNGFVADMFVRDATAGITSLVSVGAGGVQGNDNSSTASLSADGSLLAFTSWASNLVSGDSNAKSDVFVHSLSTGTTTRVSTTSSGAQGNGDSNHPSISPDGTWVGFTSKATNLVTDDTNAVADVFLANLSTGSVTRESESSDALGSEQQEAVEEGTRPVVVEESCIDIVCQPGAAVDACDTASNGPGSDPCSVRSLDLAKELVQEEMKPTPLNQALVINANVLQAFADGLGPCTSSSSPGGCGQAARERRFANRIRDLDMKDLEEDIDGMEFTPDIILLQEARRIDAQAIATALNKRYFYVVDPFGLAPPLDIQCDSPEQPPCFQVAKAFSGDDLDGTKATKTIGDTAIIFNSQTMTKASASSTDTLYSVAEACDRPLNSDPDLNDLDEDGVQDCPTMPQGKRAIKRNAMALFTENRSAYSIATSSVHLVPNSHLKDGTAREKKRQWMRKIATDLESFASTATTYSIAGDVNLWRCKNHANPPEYIDNTAPEPFCDEQDWWKALTIVGTISGAPAGENQGFGYDDSIFTVHGSNGPLTTADQFKDGNTSRTLRIDFIFTKNRLSSVGDEPAYASHDVTCGLAVLGDFDQNCNDPMNPERYSDHRLVWSFTTPVPVPVE